MLVIIIFIWVICGLLTAALSISGWKNEGKCISWSYFGRFIFWSTVSWPIILMVVIITSIKETRLNTFINNKLQEIIDEDEIIVDIEE